MFMQIALAFYMRRPLPNLKHLKCSGVGCYETYMQITMVQPDITSQYEPQGLKTRCPGLKI